MAGCANAASSPAVPVGARSYPFVDQAPWRPPELQIELSPSSMSSISRGSAHQPAAAAQSVPAGMHDAGLASVAGQATGRSGVQVGRQAVWSQKKKQTSSTQTSNGAVGPTLNWILSMK